MWKNVCSTVAAALLVGTLTGSAGAAPLMPKQVSQIAQSDGENVIQVGQRDRRDRRWRGRDRDRDHRWRQRGRRHSGSNLSFSFNFGTPYYYAPPRVVYYSVPVAWSPGWYTYCKTKYRSFNPRTGHFKTYSGRWQLCR